MSNWTLDVQGLSKTAISKQCCYTDGRVREVFVVCYFFLFIMIEVMIVQKSK